MERTRLHRGLARSILLALGATTVLLVAAAPAFAQTDAEDRNDQVVLHGELLVADGETLDTAVIFDGPVLIDGTVKETVVAFNGDVVVNGTVEQDVVAFNGDVTLRDGAEVRGDLVTQRAATIEPGATLVGRERSVATGAEVADIGFASRLAWWIGYSVSTLILGLVLLAVVPGLDPALASTIRERLGGSIGIGVAVFVLLPVAAVLLLVTLVGLPLGLFLLLAFAFLSTVGYVAGAHAVGRRVLRPTTSRYVSFLAGWGILRLLALIPVVGGILWFAATALGIGALILAARPPVAARPVAPRPDRPPVPTT